MPPRTCFARCAATAQRGFTLVELLVAGSVCAIVVVMAVHLWQDAIASMRLTAAANAFLAQLHLARSEAIKRNGPVTLCKSADSVTCTGEGGWEQGYIVFHDADDDGMREPDETVLLRFGALPPGLRMKGNTSVARQVSFAASGTTRTSTGAFQAGTMTICRRSGGATQARQVVINAVGRARIQRVTVTSCE